MAACCAYCSRPFDTTPNPIKDVEGGEPDTASVLQRRAPRSAECVVCFDYISVLYPTMSTPAGKNALKAQLNGDRPEDIMFQKEYQDNLPAHEENMRGRKRGRKGGDTSRGTKKVLPRAPKPIHLSAFQQRLPLSPNH